MNTSQEQLLRLLTLSIHGGVPAYESFSSINGKELFDLALQQNVSSFLYPTINKHRENIKLDEHIMQRWKESTLFIATRQISMINGIRIILDLFKSNGIPAISLKGLVLKQLYPQPELRNMGDIDLFIDEIYIQKSIELLSTLGYHPRSRDLNDPKYIHIVMQKPNSFSVELHRTLWRPTTSRKRINQIWINHILKNKRQQEIEGLQYTALSLEDELINLVIHLARHLMHSKANLQQLCDIVLFINAYWHMLDLEYIEQTLESMDYFTFYQYLLSACHLYFTLTIPMYTGSIDENKSEMLMNYIFISEIQSKDQSEWRRPLSDHYTFARNYPFLIPFAIVLEVGRQLMRKMKIILHSIPFTEKCLKFLRRFKTKTRFLRSIGLYLRY